MFQNMLEHLETKDKQSKLPVRKFYNNSFGFIVNDAIFALKRRQQKSSGDEAVELQSHRGQIQFVANYILNNLPEHERPNPDGERND
jgi:hypothetical protein